MHTFLHTRPDVRDLQVGIVHRLGLLLVAAGFLLFVLSLSDDSIGWAGRFVHLGLLAVGGVACALRERHPLGVRLVLALGSAVWIALGLALVSGPLVPFASILLVMLNAVINPLGGLATALLASLALLTIDSGRLLAPSRVTVCLATCWVALLIAWLSSQAFYTAVEWAWNSQRRASELLEEVRDRRGELRRTVSALTEATRRLQRVNRELLVARQEAEEARAFKEQFAANVSHELRTPLNLIVGFAELMYLNPEIYGQVHWTPSLASDVQEIYRASRQLRSLIEDVLDLSRINARRLPMFREMADLGPVLRDARDMIAPLAQQKSLWLRLDIPDQLPELLIDVTRVRQVLVNLLNNAVRFTDEGGITIRVEIGPHSVHICVSDTGVGIPKDKLGTVFDSFSQVNSGPSGRGGTGLGLSLSRDFVELHGGRMWIESIVDVGSTVSFTLPLAGSYAVHSGLARLPRVARSAAERAPVVLVDSDPGVANMLRRYMRDRPVLAATDLQRAAELIEPEHPAAILVNVPPSAPGEDAWSQEAVLAGEQYNIPIVHCSIPSTSWVSGLTDLEEWLSKPVSKDQITALLGKYCPPNGTVLVVDDDPGFVQLMERILATSGHVARTVGLVNPTQVLWLAHQTVPDLLFLDLVMPQMSGLDLLEAWRKDTVLGNIPVVAISGHSFAEEVLQRQGVRLTVTQAQGISTSALIEVLADICEHLTPNYAESAASSTR